MKKLLYSLILISTLLSIVLINPVARAFPPVMPQSSSGPFSVTDIAGQTDDTAPATTATAVLAQGGSLIESTLAEIATAINGILQPIDADLTTIAALTPVASKVMIGAAGPVWVVSAWTLADPGASGGILQSDGTNWARVTSLTGLSYDIGDAVASGHAVTMDANGVLQTAFTALLPDAADGATLGATDREWSDLILADGAVIYGQNDQSATLTSSASKWTANNFDVTGAMFVTGTIQGRAKFVSLDEATTLTAAAHNGALVRLTVAGEITLWDCATANVGDFVTLWARDAEKIEVVPASGDQFFLFDGTGIGADDELDIAATAGTKVTLMCTADNSWSVITETAASTDGGAAD